MNAEEEGGEDEEHRQRAWQDSQIGFLVNDEARGLDTSVSVKRPNP
jgi:hypothetical protein